MNLYDIIQGPIITEKSMALIEQTNRYTFKVDKRATKTEIKSAVEELFKVKVLNVHTVNVLPKKKTVGKYTGFKPAYKKAICQLAAGDKINAFNM